MVFVESIDEMSSGKALAHQMMCNVLECSPNLSGQCLNVRTVRVIQVNVNYRNGLKGFRNHSYIVWKLYLLQSNTYCYETHCISTFELFAFNASIPNTFQCLTQNH